MQFRPSFFALALTTTALAVACGDSADPAAQADDDDDDTPSGSSSSGASGSSGSTGSSSSSGGKSSSSSSGGSTSSSGGTDAGTTPEKPADCTVLVPTTFANGPGLTPHQYGAQPTFRGEVVSPEGDASLNDLLLVRIDAATGIGTHEVTFPAADFNCFGNGAQCVYLQEDVDAGVSNRFYAATRGRIRIDAQITTDQSQGVIEYVELREAFLESRNVPYNGATPITDGKCLWIESAAFDTRRPEGCNPIAAADACAPAKTCIPENVAGSDGTCRDFGEDENGVPCDVEADGSSNCAAGFTCSHDGANSKCRKVCDLMAAGNECPDDTVCSTFGYCEPQTVEEDVGFGETCSQVYDFCGTDGHRGLCFPDTDDHGEPVAAKACGELQRSRAACGEQELAYIQFDGFEDRSLGRCVTKY